MSSHKRTANPAPTELTKNPIARVIHMDAPLEQIFICDADIDISKKVMNGRYLTPEQAGELGKLHEIFEPTSNLLAGRIHHVIAAPGALVLYLIIDNETVPPPTLRDIYEPFLQAEAELITNSKLSPPARYKSATKHPSHAEVLKVLAYSDCRAILCSGQELVAIPKLKPECFTGGQDNAKLEMEGPFPVVGIRRDDNAGHCLLVGRNDTRVRLPDHNPCFSWEAIHNLLELRHELTGSIARKTKADDWMPTANAKIVPVSDLLHC